MCLNGTPLGSVKMQSAQLPQVTELKYLGSTLQSDGDMSTEVKRGRNVDGTTGGRCQTSYVIRARVPPHVKGKIHKTIVQPAMLYGTEPVPATSSHVKKLEMTEMKMGMWPHTKRPCEKRLHQ